MKGCRPPLPLLPCDSHRCSVRRCPSLSEFLHPSPIAQSQVLGSLLHPRTSGMPDYPGIRSIARFGPDTAPHLPLSLYQADQAFRRTVQCSPAPTHTHTHTHILLACLLAPGLRQVYCPPPSCRGPSLFSRRRGKVRFTSAEKHKDGTSLPPMLSRDVNSQYSLVQLWDTCSRILCRSFRPTRVQK